MPIRKVPAKLLIGPVWYDIIVQDIKDDDIGKCIHIHTKIKLHKTMSDEQKVATSFHEMLHAVIFEHSICEMLGMEHKDHEKLVSLLSPTLLAVLRNNPEYVDFIMGGNHGRSRARTDRALQECGGSRDAGDRDARVESGRRRDPDRLPAA